MRFGTAPARASTNAETDSDGYVAVNESSHDVSQTADHAAEPAVGAAPHSIWRRVRQDVIVLGLGSVSIVIAQLGFRSILIAALVPAAYGRLSLILSIYSTVMIIGASGLPNGTARYIAASDPADDSTIVRTAIRANIWPTVMTAIVVGTAAGILLKSVLAFLFAVIGLSSLVYSLLATGILRGRGRTGSATSILPFAAFSEVGLLAVLWFLFRDSFSMMSAFGVFCLGNVFGLFAAIAWTHRTAPARVDTTLASPEGSRSPLPSSRQMLGFSMWIGVATIGVTIMPLVMRFGAALDSYSVVAMIDVALVLLQIPQRVGAVIVSAVVPHATKALGKGTGINLTITRREHIVMIVPFIVGAIIVAYTPLVGTAFDLLGRPTYAKAADFLALALLAGPARILYGLVQGVLIAHGEARFLATKGLSITGAASILIFAAMAVGTTTMAFAIFVAACWVAYLNGLARVHQLTAPTGS